MTRFMVIARVNGCDYLTKVEAQSAYGAEHKIIDTGVCGKHEYGVENCMAYDLEAMKTDTFRYNAINAEPISYDDLVKVINERNAEIVRKDCAEDKMREIERQMKLLQEEYNKAQEIYTA